jgi:glyoxylase-like metal-dependent hydrolase (beta-lactamase superfamily II)
VIAGDAVYNETRPFLLESGHRGRLAWLQAIDKIAALNPSIVIAGHGPLTPDNSPSTLKRPANTSATSNTSRA